MKKLIDWLLTHPYLSAGASLLTIVGVAVPLGQMLFTDPEREVTKRTFDDIAAWAAQANEEIHLLSSSANQAVSAPSVEVREERISRIVENIVESIKGMQTRRAVPAGPIDLIDSLSDEIRSSLDGGNPTTAGFSLCGIEKTSRLVSSMLEGEVSNDCVERLYQRVQRQLVPECAGRPDHPFCVSPLDKHGWEIDEASCSGLTKELRLTRQDFLRDAPSCDNRPI